MYSADGRVLLSPTDLSNFLACHHRTGLDLAVALGHLAKPTRTDPVTEALQERGEEHERRYVEALRARGLTVVEIARSDDMAGHTMEAMRSGASAVVQARLEGEGLGGYADVLIRVDRPSALGAWSYEAQDTKLSRETRGGTILQLCAYSVMLGRLQGAMPERFHVVMPGASGGDPKKDLPLFPAPAFSIDTFRLDDYSAYYRMVLTSLRTAIEPGHDALTSVFYPEPVAHCDVCRWEARCYSRRRKDDHLSFVADVSRLHRRELAEHGIATLEALAAMTLPPPFKPKRGSARAYERAHHQARVQREQRQRHAPVHELLPLEEGKGLLRLPAPSTGDLFLDLEGSSFAREGGREFLFGACQPYPPHQAHPPHPEYHGRWASNDLEEKRAFEDVVDQIIRTLDEHPDMHVYHFSPYEPAAFKRLMGRYASREDAIDRLLRGERFVDLHAVLRHTLRAGVESYSLKQLEPFYGFTRSVALADAGAALLQTERFLELGRFDEVSTAMRAAIEAYNQDDCRSTQALRDWLEGLRADVEASGTPVPRPAPQDDAPSENLANLQARTELLRELLMAGLPADRMDDTPTQAPRRLLANLLDWHRREHKVQWWEYFRLRDLPEEELFDERKAIAGLTFDSRVLDVVSKKTGKPTGSVIVRYRFPAQEMEIDRDDEVKLKDGSKFGDVVAVDRVARTIDIKQGRKMADARPSAIFEHRNISPKAMQESMLRLAEDMLRSSASSPSRCGLELLHRAPLRLADLAGDPGKGSPPRDDESPVERAVRVVQALDRSTLAIQGPPGAGKTYTGAEMICALLKDGKKVAVTAVSHRVIRNLLDAVRERAAGLTQAVIAGHKVRSDEDIEEASPVKEFGDNAEALAALAGGAVQVLGATSWLWAREEAANAADVLFVDEAGQMSLANVLAASSCAGSLVLLGDPQQLDQPQKGSHPDGADVSALEHVLGGHQTMPDGMGMFLPITWRLAPEVCRFTSEVFYEGRLTAKAGLERQRLDGCGAFDGAGVWCVPVDHDGNRHWSQEEIDEVVRLVDVLLAPGARWTDEHGESRAMRAADILVVAPYNAQVNRLDDVLGPRGVRVGTVDRFQGQEAPVAIYLMATSRPEDAPRGMEFLYSLNRLNVATSRARCAAIIVASPRLFEAECRTPRQMQLANALCRFREMTR